MTVNYPGGVHPYADMFPLLEGFAYVEIMNDIEVHGLAEPIIVTADDVLVDGRNRWQMCQALGITPEVRKLSADTTDEEILNLIVSKNVMRRHLTVNDKTVAAVGYKHHLASITRSGRRPADEEDLSPDGDSSTASPKYRTSVARAADKVGVGVTTVERALRVERDAPDLYEKVKNNEMTINGADRERAERQLHEQKLATASDDRVSAGGRIGAIKVPSVNPGGGRSTAKRVTAILSQLKAAAEVVEVLGPEVFDAEAAEEFKKSLSALNSFRRKLKST